MKKLLTLLLAAIMTLSLFAGCSLEEKEKEIADNTPVATVDGQVVLTWGAYKSHYNEYVGQFYQYYGAYPEDIGYTTAASDILGYYTEDAIVAYRGVMGATNPEKADAGTIRKELAESIEANTVHGSDSAASAAREIAYFFDAAEIVG